MLGDGSVEDSDNFSMENPVCIDGVIFYGPITDRERIVKERFERRQKERVKTQILPALPEKKCSENVMMPVDESKNELNDISIYESFSIEESKYESFNDSLDEGKHLKSNEVNVSKFPSENINVNVRKFPTKMLKGSLCDSLEDIHSLVSNVEKLSISEEIENINIIEKNNLYEDSLRNDACLENKNAFSIDQNFDDDSLAILEFEKTFDDSLEEADILSFSHMENVVILRNGENDNEVSVDNLTKENTVTKNLFETSVEIIYENAGYVENSEEENAEALKQVSLTADSLSISENISKDSLDGLSLFPKYLEQKTSKKSLSSLNREKLEPSLSPHDQKYGSIMNPSSDQNLSHDVHEIICDQFTDMKNTSYSNDTIIVEDSFYNSFDANKVENFIKHKSSISHKKDFSSKLPDCFVRDNYSKLSPYSASNTNSVINNNAKISDKKVNTPEVHPNDTIFIDDSFNLPHNTSLIKDEMHPFETQTSGNQKDNKHIFSAEINGTGCLKISNSCNNSFAMSPQPMLCMNREKSLSKDRDNKEKSSQGKDSEIFVQSPVYEQLEEKNKEAKDSKKLNGTIFIDCSPVEALKTKTDKSTSFTGIDSEKIRKSSFKGNSSKDKNIDSKSIISNLNDTIYIDSLPAETKIKMDKNTSFTCNASKKKRKSPLRDSCLKDKNVDSKATISNMNTTIYIDCSPVESLRIKMEKSTTSSVKSPKVQSPEFKNCNVSIHNPPNSCEMTKSDNSPLKKLNKSSASNNGIKNTPDVINFCDDPLVIFKDLPKDDSLNLQLEKKINVNQDINIISLSTVDQCSNNIQPSVTKFEMVKMDNQYPALCDKNKSKIEIKAVKICGSNCVSDNITSEEYDSNLPEVKTVVLNSYPEKNKSSSIFVNDAQNSGNVPNCQLLEALDLHDTSYSFVDNGFLQSRDSIMPLNLCIRNKSPDYQYFIKPDSKENIPFFDKQLSVGTSIDHANNKRRSTKTPNKTPKQLKFNADVKKSGAKTNSITKIPVRKIDNPFFTPVHQVCKDVKTGSSTEKVLKNPLVKSMSATDNLTSTKSLETPRKHHFCSVRNSISRVPKSTPRLIPKKFRNIESPIAKYIGKPQIYTPLKTTHRYDGNLILGDTMKAGKNAIKTPNNACKASPQCSAGKL